MNKLSIKNKLTKVLENSLKELNIDFDFNIDVTIEKSQNKQGSDYFTNISQILSQKINLPPMEIANNIKEKIKDNDFIDEITISNLGLINFSLKKEFILSYINKIISEKSNYGRNNYGNGKKVNIEFLSVNPTEKILINHGIEITYGDNLARLLSFSGFDVTKECYVNDSLDETNDLGISIKEKYKEICNMNNQFLENDRDEKNVIEIAKEIYSEYGDSKLVDDIHFFRQKGIDIFLKKIKADLDYYRVNFNTFTSEQSLYDKCLVEDIINKLNKSGNCYIKDNTLWLKTTSYGDEKDRILIKNNGNYTYLTPYIAYHLDKINYGYNRIINVLVEDKKEYKTQLESSLKILETKNSILDIKTLPKVKLIKNNKELKWSKWTESSITLMELIDEVGINATRYFFSSHNKDNSLIDFNIDLALKQSNENPIYYIENANAKISSILRKYRKVTILEEYLTLKNNATYIILDKLIQFEDIVLDATKKENPSIVASYIYELVDLFYSIYSNKKFIMEDENINIEEINLLIAIQIVIQNSLDLLGIIPKEEM